MTCSGSSVTTRAQVGAQRGQARAIAGIRAQRLDERWHRPARCEHATIDLAAEQQAPHEETLRNDRCQEDRTTVPERPGPGARCVLRTGPADQAKPIVD